VDVLVLTIEWSYYVHGTNTITMSWHFIFIDSASFRTPLSTGTIVGSSQSRCLSCIQQAIVTGQTSNCDMNTFNQTRKSAQTLRLPPRSPVRIFAGSFRALFQCLHTLQLRRDRFHIFFNYSFLLTFIKTLQWRWWYRDAATGCTI